MSDPTIKAALDAAEREPTTARKIQRFLRALPSPGTQRGLAWWAKIPAHDETRLWLAAAVEEAARNE